MKAILIERDYKGSFERYALTLHEFETKFADELLEGMPAPFPEAQSWTLSPLVHMWYIEAETESPFWETFFTDMAWGLSDTDIININYAEVRIDLMNDLVSELPLIVRADKMLDDIYQVKDGKSLAYEIETLRYFRGWGLELNKHETYAFAKKIGDLYLYTSAPLLSAEYIDALCVLLSEGVAKTRNLNLPEISADRMKEFLMCCDMDTFSNILEYVALCNQNFYAPDNEELMIKNFEMAYDVMERFIGDNGGK